MWEFNTLLSFCFQVTGIDENKNGVSAVSEVDISKPSSSSAVDVVDDSQDREDVMPRRSRSTRGRKKPVIEDSQEKGKKRGNEGNN